MGSAAFALRAAARHPSDPLKTGWAQDKSIGFRCVRSVKK